MSGGLLSSHVCGPLTLGVTLAGYRIQNMAYQNRLQSSIYQDTEYRTWNTRIDYRAPYTRIQDTEHVRTE